MSSLENKAVNAKTDQVEPVRSLPLKQKNGTTYAFTNFLESVVNHLRISIERKEYSIQERLIYCLVLESKKELLNMTTINAPPKVSPAAVKQQVLSNHSPANSVVQSTESKPTNNQSSGWLPLPTGSTSKPKSSGVKRKEIPGGELFGDIFPPKVRKEVSPPLNGLRNNREKEQNVQTGVGKKGGFGKKFSWIDDDTSSSEGSKKEETNVAVSPEIDTSVDNVELTLMNSLNDLEESSSKIGPATFQPSPRSKKTKPNSAIPAASNFIAASANSLEENLPQPPLAPSILADNLSAVLQIDLSLLPTKNAKSADHSSSSSQSKEADLSFPSSMSSQPKTNSGIKQPVVICPKCLWRGAKETDFFCTNCGTRIRTAKKKNKKQAKRKSSSSTSPKKKRSNSKSNSKSESKGTQKRFVWPRGRQKTWMDLIWVFFNRKNLKGKPQMRRRAAKSILSLFENDSLTEKPVLFDLVAGFLKINKNILCSTTLYVLQHSFTRWWNRAVRKEVEDYFMNHIDGFNYVSMADILKFPGVVKLLNNHTDEKMTRIIAGALERSETLYYQKSKKICQRKNPAQNYPPIPKQKNLPRLPRIKGDEEESERKRKQKLAKRKRQRALMESLQEPDGGPEFPPGLESPSKRQRKESSSGNKSEVEDSSSDSGGLSNDLDQSEVVSPIKPKPSPVGKALNQPTPAAVNGGLGKLSHKMFDPIPGIKKKVSLDVMQPIPEQDVLLPLPWSEEGESQKETPQEKPSAQDTDTSKGNDDSEEPLKQKPLVCDDTETSQGTSKKREKSPTQSEQVSTSKLSPVPEKTSKKQTNSQPRALPSPSLSPSPSPKPPPPLQEEKESKVIEEVEESVEPQTTTSKEDAEVVVEPPSRVFKPAFMKDKEDNEDTTATEDFFDFSGDVEKEPEKESNENLGTDFLDFRSDSSEPSIIFPAPKPKTKVRESPKVVVVEEATVVRKPTKVVSVPKSNNLQSPSHELPRIRAPPPPPSTRKGKTRTKSTPIPRSAPIQVKPVRKLPPKPNLWTKPLSTPSVRMPPHVRMPPPPNRFAVPAPPSRGKPFSSVIDNRPLPSPANIATLASQRSGVNAGKIPPPSYYSEYFTRTVTRKPGARTAQERGSLSDDRRRKRSRRTRSRSPSRQVGRRRSPSRLRRERSRRSPSQRSSRKRRSPSRRSRRSSPPHRRVSARPPSPKTSSKRRRVERRSSTDRRRRPSTSQSRARTQPAVVTTAPVANNPPKKKKKERAKMRKPDDPEVVSAFERITRKQLYTPMYGEYNIRKNLRGDDDIAVGQIKVSLRDPFSLCTIQAPARGKKVCTHIQPFDLKVFLQQGDRPRICPVCNAEVPEALIVVDKYLESVFASARRTHDQSLEAIFFYLEGDSSSKLRWKPDIEGRVPGAF